jgi:DNA N-6-adenine-methyltransferase (Dam)
MDGRCYFGCEGPIRHTLLELPAPYSGAPNLCEDHSRSWRAYQATLKGGGGHPSWPEDFWPWADKERKAMEEVKTNPRQTEDRVPGTEILAEEAVVGAWYEVLSGETERCIARRSRGRGIQVGFVSVFDPGNDPDDIRWLPGRTKITVEDEIEAAKLLASLAEDGKLPSVAGDLAFGDCPRNGLLCSVCEAPQRVTPSGAICENGHGGAPGQWNSEAQSSESAALSSLAALAQETEADNDFMAMGASQDSAYGDPNSTSPTLREAYPEAFERAEEGDQTTTAGEAAKVYSDALEAEKVLTKRLGAGPTVIFHKSLHTDHRTPKELFEAEVERWGRFYLDCAATEENKLCEYALTPEIDALSVDWAGTEEIYTQHGRNRWLNHPYSRGEKKCAPDCTKPKCDERGYHLEHDVASSGEWLKYARDQVLKDGIPTDVLTKAAVETNWWRDAIRIQPPEAGAYITGAVDPLGGPAAEYLNATSYKAATWFRFTWAKLIVEVTEIEGRVAFEREGNDGGAGFASALVMFYRPGHKFHE